MTLRKDNIRRISGDLDETVAEALEASAEIIAAAARARAPVETGTLRDSIRVRPTDTGRAVEATAFYAHMVENGTVKTPPRPFLVPAFEANKAQIDDRIRAAVQRLIDRGGHL